MVNPYFWGKKEEKDGVQYWLPLYQHLEDTKEVADLLWEHWLGEGQRRIIADSLDSESRYKGKDLAVFLAAVHDFGKATPAFQTKKSHSYSADLDISLLEKLERVGFDGISSLVLASPQKTPHNIAGQYLLQRYGVGEDIATIIGGHHGKPVDSRENIENQTSYLKNYYQSENKDSEICRKWENAQREFFEWALEVSRFECVEDLPHIKQSGQVILTGLVIMADWIASNQAYFPLILVEDDFIPNKEERARQGFLKWQKSRVWEAEYSPDYVDLYYRRFGFEPRNVQAVLSEIIDKVDKPGIFIVEAPMGSGKTESALVVAEQLAYKTGRSGLFFGLPTQATSNGIFPRIKNWLDSICKEQHETMQLRLSHGKAYLNENFSNLAKGVYIDDPDENSNGSIIVNEWFSGRKTSSLDDFVVGTVDQFLMLALKQKHLVLRHLGFSKKVVIIDEVHAYDAYMSQYLLQAIKWMGAYRTPLIILSATLPSERRIQLIKSYMAGMGKKLKKSERKEFQEKLKTDDYPLITYNDGDEVYQVREFEKSVNKQVSILKIGDEELFDVVEESICEGGIVGIVVNTVKRAQEMAQELSEKFGEDAVLLLHSAFIATDRVHKEKQLLGIIGDKAKRPFSKIVVGTQVIEQSLDIDFDVMISDLAPMDLLIQRMGRLHRHSIERPQKHQNAKFYVLGTNDEYDFEQGSSYVYGDYILMRTQYYLPDSIYLPQDISSLVQKVYKFDEILENFELEDINQKYEAFKKEYDGKIKEKEGKAKIYRISDPVLKKSMANEETLIGWLDKSIVGETEEKANAQVRDIEPTIEVVALRKIGTGYGLFGKEDDISDDILDHKVGKLVAQNTITLPRVLSKSYNIDKTIEALEKYTLQNLPKWQQSIWLKGSLGIIFDENNEFVMKIEKKDKKEDILSMKLRYDEKYGIYVERM